MKLKKRVGNEMYLITDGNLS